MKKIVLPPQSETWKSEDLIRQVVLTQPHWREQASLSLVNNSLEIDKALDDKAPDENILQITNDAHSELVKAMAKCPSLSPPNAQKFFMQLFKAVLKAEDAEEKEK